MKYNINVNKSVWRPLRRPSRARPDASPLCSLGLTPRETEVLTWIAQGKTNYEIGAILGACTGTICKHVERILRKLCVENRTSGAADRLCDAGQAKRMSRAHLYQTRCGHPLRIEDLGRGKFFRCPFPHPAGEPGTVPPRCPLKGCGCSSPSRRNARRHGAMPL